MIQNLNRIINLVKNKRVKLKSNCETNHPSKRLRKVKYLKNYYLFTACAIATVSPATEFASHDNTFGHGVKKIHRYLFALLVEWTQVSYQGLKS